MYSFKNIENNKHFFIGGSLFNIGRYFQIIIMRPGTRVKVFQKDMCNC